MTDRVACLTPPGAAALATLAVRGPRAWEVVRALFRTPSGAELATELQPGQFRLGRFGAELADEVVLAVKQLAPEPWLEIHCHGGREVLRVLLETLAKQGIFECSWQVMARQTAASALSAEAAIALAHAPTTHTAAILLDQYHGAFGRAVSSIIEALSRGETSAVCADLEKLYRYCQLGRHLTAPWRVAVVGAPNVGKSSLVNALAGFQRSVVAPTPGTTRDVVTINIALDGWPIELADTAGLRDTAEFLESAGMEQARAAALAADLTLWVLDASAEPVWPTFAMSTLLYVVNKVDLPTARELARARGGVHVSAMTGAGMDELIHSIVVKLVPHIPGAGEAVPFTDALCTQVETAWHGAELGDWQEVERWLRSVEGTGIMTND